MNKNSTCEKKSGITDAQRMNSLYQAVEHFEYSSELAKRVYHLGKPCFTDSMQTASLGIMQNGHLHFNFNRSFFDDLDEDEMIFVIFHEVLHYTFLHLFRCLDRLPALWNIACDLVVNNFLLEKVGFGNIHNSRFSNFLKTAVTFENLGIVPVNQRSSLTAEEVYELLEKNQKILQRKTGYLRACDEHEWSNDKIQDVSKDGKNTDNLPEQTESDKGQENKDNEMMEELIEQTQKIFRDWTSNWGDTQSGELRAIGEINKSVDMSWDLILSRRIASCIKLACEERWAPPNRKIAYLYPDVLLPADIEVEQVLLSILMAIDASGSILPCVLDKFVAIARSIPKNRVQLIAISFDTGIYPVDIWAKAPKILGGGGTSFNAIDVFARQMNKYPDLVVVLTDGFASHPTILYPERWFWLITEQGNPKNIEGIGRNLMIKSLL